MRFYVYITDNVWHDKLNISEAISLKNQRLPFISFPAFSLRKKRPKIIRECYIQIMHTMHIINTYHLQQMDNKTLPTRNSAGNKYCVTIFLKILSFRIIAMNFPEFPKNRIQYKYIGLCVSFLFFKNLKVAFFVILILYTKIMLSRNLNAKKEIFS